MIFVSLKYLRWIWNESEMQFYNSKNADSKRVNLLNFWQLSVKKLLSKRQMLQCYVCYNLKFALEWKIKVKQNVFYLEFNYYRQNMLPNGITFGLRETDNINNMITLIELTLWLADC
jgi:hypothetical protein